MKMKTRTTAILLAVGVIVVISAGPAFADQGAAVIGSQAYYTSNNKQLSAQDTQNDGKSAIAQFRRGTSGAITEIVNSDGNGSVKYATVSVTSGTSAYIRACTQDLGGGGARSCGSWVALTA